MELNNANKQFGLPTYDLVSEDIRQQYDDTCAIKSQEIIMNAVGLNVNEEELRLEVYENGWYIPGVGTPMENVGKLMESHGLEVQQELHGSMFNLVGELSKGHPVIVGVDSGELWHPGIDETFEDIISGKYPDHALVVGGIEFNEDFSGGIVNIIDPGTGDFAASYDMEQFEDAWNDSDNFMVSLT